MLHVSVFFFVRSWCKNPRPTAVRGPAERQRRNEECRGGSKSGHGQKKHVHFLYMYGRKRSDDAKKREGGKMQLRAWIVWIASVIVLTWSPAVMVQAQTVAFSDITDAVPSRFFDAATTTPDPHNGNKLLIGFSTGFDATTWTVNEFTASTAAFHHAFAMDTISFLIAAPHDFYIAKITYTQRGTHAISRTGIAAGGVHWVVDGVPADLGLFHPAPPLSGTINLTGQNKTLVPVSITCGLFAFATPLLGPATIAMTSAEVLVELLPLRQ
jgi:hypothetical protein